VAVSETDCEGLAVAVVAAAVVAVAGLGADASG